MELEDATYDYGLDPGESFDPDDDIDVDRSSPHIMSVLGPIDPGALGPVNLAASFVPRQPDADIADVLNEIQESAVVGLNGLVDLRPIESSHAARAALWLAERSDIHLIVATGIQPEAGAPANIARLIDEAANGLHGTRVLPGLIVVMPVVESIQIGQSASEATGLPLLIDARASTVLPNLADDQVRMAVRVDNAAGNTGHLLVDLATGEIDSVIANLVLPNVHNQRILVGYDPAGKGSALFSRWNWLIEEFPIALLEAGLDPWQARSLMIDAPADFLTINVPAPTRC